MWGHLAARCPQAQRDRNVSPEYHRNTLNGEGKRGDRFEICPQIIQMGVFQQPVRT